jgi:hypothetical protein
VGGDLHQARLHREHAGRSEPRERRKVERPDRVARDDATGRRVQHADLPHAHDEPSFLRDDLETGRE